MSSTSEGHEPGPAGPGGEISRRVLAAVEAAGPGAGIWDVMQATGLSLAEVTDALEALTRAGGPRENTGFSLTGDCLHGGIPGQGKSGALRIIGAEAALREGGPHGRG